MPLFCPYATLQEHASRQPNAEAIIVEDTKVTYAEFLERVVSAGSVLLRDGLVAGEVTGICIHDEIDHLVVTASILCLGTPQIALGSHETNEAKRALASKVGVTQLIVDRVEAWMDGFRTIVLPRASYNVSSTTPAELVREYPGSLISIYVSTSGSTNVPRALGFTLERFFAAIGRYAEPSQRRGLRIGSIELDAHRLYRLSLLVSGSACIFLRRFNLSNLIDVCERHKVSIVHLNPSKIVSLIRHSGSSRRLPAYTMALAGGARVPGAMRKEVSRVLTDNLWIVYSTAEVGQISCASPDQHEEFPEGLGFPDENLTAEIVDAQGKLVAPGEIGEIRVRKPRVFQGYEGDAEKSSNFADGWFYPRDLISKKEGAPLIFHGRADDVMILNSININPSAIEDILESHPDVAEAAAYPVRSRVHGEIPVAAVVLKEDTHCDVEALLNHCRVALGMRAPRQIFVVESLPRNAAGKVLRRALSESH
jgi:acyl-CoA synthetase (AMP-forming)/AMP-acid ligase II